ncbi:MAG TPA: DUF2971 domain-containing protein [Cyclobacteriaceae bacterium]|nr:DUF2971 domain-containing protein [Cyclobacteriaceae bacterium]HMV07486.1 DUF2971 domain-containing protein [Cyclobacteriaceae bacterium]HMW99159.1 DUF2971 domain-containing protein [Cyclobacteriaceae bacterium]HMX48208.1 DUF2971 domain-containing protein [Cyclobacteriaceae bacterium]HMY95013.1 DUF2971 domain-containing protein [Cyclobacteriaceae bacterium]
MEITQKELKIQTQLKRLLSGVLFKSARAGNDDGVNQSHFLILPDNSNLYHSQYCYKEKPKFIHFTSLDKLKSIIRSKSLRLYNLHNLNDPREYSFAGDLMEFNAANRADAKENMFLLSMCKTDILRGPLGDEFNMWRLYGAYGKGVCIQFDFSMNKLDCWRDYFLSKVFYGASSKTNLKELNKMLSKLENDRPKTTIDLGQIVAFHKSNLYKLEKEVRLVFDNRKKKVHGARQYSESSGELLSPILSQDLGRSAETNKTIKYLELPIYHESFNFISENIPIPKIEKVILGFTHTDYFEDVSKEINTIIDDNLGYKVKVELSRVAKYYFEK